MKRITFYLDFISPYAWLAFDELPRALMGLSYSVAYQPVLLGALLRHHGQLGPAEIAAKRDWTYRHVLWLAHCRGLALRMPTQHPFNPLGPLRLALACDAAGLPNRYVCETVLRHVWESGGDAADPQRLAALARELAPARDPSGDAVKADLKAATDAAIDAGVFGVPAFAVDGKVFWGQDALPMLRAYLQGDDWFAGKDWSDAASVPAGVSRSPAR
jgi:2-hydroxychromene-2-carboxylate isomerase